MRDVKTVFRDEAFMARIWDEANRRLSAEKPDVDQELGKVETQAAPDPGPDRPLLRGV